MLPNRMKAGLLRPILALLALAGLLALGGCGGGSGAPNNPFAQQPAPIGPLFVLPPTLTAYSHTPATLTVSGGAPPYQAFTGNQSLLPVTQIVNGDTIVLLPNDVAAATPVVITVQDSIGQTATSTVTVSPAPLFNTLTITPARAACGANTVCSGDIATATVTVAGTGGAGIPNRQVKFDVVTGAFFILSNNPAQPLVSTLTVVSDANGVATVVLQAAVNAPTQPAILRATEVSSGNSVNGVFTIVQQTSGSAILSVVPADRDHYRRLRQPVQLQFPRRLLHLWRHATLYGCLDIPGGRYACEFRGTRFRWILHRDHQRQLRQPAGVHDRRFGRPADDGHADQPARHRDTADTADTDDADHHARDHHRRPRSEQLQHEDVRPGDLGRHAWL